MSTPEQPNTPPLTRRQLREIRNTGATPVVGPIDGVEPGVEEDTFVVQRPSRTATQGASAEQPAPVAVLPKPAVPVAVPPAPVPDASVDLGVSPLTRRQARQQERIRTASVPVITPELAAQFASTTAVDDADGAGETLVQVADVEDEATEDRPVVAADFGAELLAGEPAKTELPPTFDQLISRDTASAGSVATPNALILSQTPSSGPLTGPIASTGEVLVTGSYDLPEGLGSTGHAPGVADGKEVDAVLVDGEMPAHSSPTPIAASAAISTVKTDGEIIRPPAPEKGSKLMLTLAITAGALALALVGVLILAFVTGVFS